MMILKLPPFHFFEMIYSQVEGETKIAISVLQTLSQAHRLTPHEGRVMYRVSTFLRALLQTLF